MDNIAHKEGESDPKWEIRIAHGESGCYGARAAWTFQRHHHRLARALHRD